MSRQGPWGPGQNLNPSEARRLVRRIQRPGPRTSRPRLFEEINRYRYQPPYSRSVPPPPIIDNWDTISRASTEHLGEDPEVDIPPEEEIKIVIPIVRNLERTLPPNLLTGPSPSDAEDGSGQPFLSIQYKNLKLNGLDGIERQLRTPTQKENLSTLKRYLIGKKKGRDSVKSAFSLTTGQTSGIAGERCFFIKIDVNLLEKISRTLKNASILASLRVKGSTNNSSDNVPHNLFLLNIEREAEAMFLPVGGTGRTVSSLLRSRTPGVLKLNCAQSEFIEVFTVLTAEGSSLHLTLTIKVECSKAPKSRELVKLGSDNILQAMYNLEEGKDVTIVASNGAEIKCHKGILMAHSDSFRSMLSPEQGTGRIELNENSEEGLREFVRFLYGFELPLEGITSEMALELFRLGNKYKVKKLEDSLKYFLCEKTMDFYSVDALLQLYFTVRNVECLEELRAHALSELSKLGEDVLRGSEYFLSLCSEDKVDLLFQLLEWAR